MTEACPTCGTPVKVIGGETKHYEPLDPAKRQLEDLRDWAESQANSYNAAPPSLANAGQAKAYGDVVRWIEGRA